MFEPIHIPGGGSRIGNTYLSEFDVCPRRWFYLYGFPTGLREDGCLVDHTEPTQHVGLRIERGLALHAGSAFHAAIEAWFRSGCRDGEDTGQYDLDAALPQIDQTFSKVTDPLDTLQLERERDDMKALFVSYHETFGPGGSRQDWPNIKIACDPQTGEPMLEREFELDLGNGYIFTCKPDAFVTENNYLKVMEHKTSSVWYAKGKLLSMQYETQPTAELYTLRTLYPEDILDGVLVNVVMKDRGRKSSKYEIAERVSVQRTDDDLEGFRRDTIQLLEAISTAVDTFDNLMFDEHDWVTAMQASFPERGRRTERCYKFNRECEFYSLCQSKGNELNLVRQFRTRSDALETSIRLDEDFLL